MIEIVKPSIRIDITIPEDVRSRYCRFYIEPFERGYGITIGNSLRRILLSSIEGSAITAVRIEGVTHEFDAIPGVLEDVSQIILNLKYIRLKVHGNTPREMRLRVTGPKRIFAKDIEHDSAVEILTPDVYIAEVVEGGKFDCIIEIDKGRGYTPAELIERQRKKFPHNTIFVDAVFNPVVKVAYEVRSARVGERTDYDALVMDIWTDGSITPDDALKKAAEILIDQLIVFSMKAPKREERREDERARKFIMEIMDKSIEKLGISQRAVSTLKEAGIIKISELVKKTEKELLEIKNLGRKTIEDIREKLEEVGLSLGMEAGKP